MLRKKNITLNGKKASGNELLAEGDSISFFFSEESFNKFRYNSEAASNDTIQTALYEKAYAQLNNIKVVFENQHILLADKPSGVLSQKSDNKDLSVNEWLIGYLLASKQISKKELETFHPSICNRLDRNTSGIIICSKSLKGARLMNYLIKERIIGKYYLARVNGILKDDMRLNGYLLKDEKHNTVKIFKHEVEGADKIETAYKVINSGKNSTLLEVELVTGKSHQIRAHLASIGHSIIGDPKYGEKGFKDGQLLHAYKLVFPKDLEDDFSDLKGKTFVSNPKWLA